MHYCIILLIHLNVFAGRSEGDWQCGIHAGRRGHQQLRGVTLPATTTELTTREITSKREFIIYYYV